MPDLDRVGQILNALPPCDLADAMLGDQPRPIESLFATLKNHVAEQLFLQNVPCGFVGLARHPRADGLVKTPPGPPVRIQPGQVQRVLVAAGACLADPVSRHEQPGPEPCARIKKPQVLDVQVPRRGVSLLPIRKLPEQQRFSPGLVLCQQPQQLPLPRRAQTGQIGQLRIRGLRQELLHPALYL